MLSAVATSSLQRKVRERVGRCRLYVSCRVIDVHDPLEGVSAVGTITTGVDRTRVAIEFASIIDAAVDAVRHRGDHPAVYLYGSVATGQARVGTSDVDMLTVDLPAEAAEAIADDLSTRFAAVCRGVEIATAHTDDFVGDTDEAYGGRVFLHHYCVHLVGPHHDHSVNDFPADKRAARGFNGDIAQHVRRWRNALDAGDDPASVARLLARKTLLAVAGLVSIHDHTWTTDRQLAERRWTEIDPAGTDGVADLLTWIDGHVAPSVDGVVDALNETVDPIVTQFANMIGLWPDHTP